MPSNAQDTKEERLNLLISVKNKQLISNFQAGIAVEANQLEAQPKNGIAYKINTCMVR